MRIGHYVKNFVIFLPVFIHNLSFQEILNLILCFLVFSFIASAGYLFNDMKDLSSDRAHLVKQHRPLASGKINQQMTILLTTFLFISSLFLSLLINIKVFYCISIYAILSVLYTSWLKKIVFFDLFFLSFFYVLRIISGVITINKPISNWLIFFSFIFFINLSSIKRIVDLSGYKESFQEKLIYNKLSIKILKITTIILALAIFVSWFIYSHLEDSVFQSTSIGFILGLLFFVWNIYIIKKSFDEKIHKDIISFVCTDFFSLSICFLGFCVLLFNYSLIK